MSIQNYQQFFKNSPKPASPYREKVAFKRDVKARSEKTEDIKKLESPVKGEMRPAYMVNFHARERRGKPMLSYTMSCSAVDFGAILAHWICDASERLKYDPNAMAHAISVAIKDATDKQQTKAK